MEIIKVTKQDAIEVSTIYAKSWKVAYQGILPQLYLDELSNERWLPMFEDSNIECFALKVQGTFVATLSLSVARDDTMPNWGEIISLYVLPEHFHKGYGSYLFAFAIQYLRNQGSSFIYLWVLEDNKKARSFYEKHEFLPNGDQTCINIDGQAFNELKYYCK